MKNRTLLHFIFVAILLLFSTACSELAFHVSNQKAASLASHEIQAPLIDTFSEPYRHTFNLVTNDGREIRVQSQSLKIDFQNLKVRANFQAQPKTAVVYLDLIQGEQKTAKRLFGTFNDLGTADLNETAANSRESSLGHLRARVRCVEQCSRVVVDIYFRSETRVFHKQFESDLDNPSTQQPSPSDETASRQNVDPELLEMGQGEEDIATPGEYATKPVEDDFMKNVTPLIRDQDLEIEVSVRNEERLPQTPALPPVQMRDAPSVNPSANKPQNAGTQAKSETQNQAQQVPARPAQNTPEAATVPSREQGSERRDGLTGPRNRGSLRGGHVAPLYPRDDKEITTAPNGTTAPSELQVNEPGKNTLPNRLAHDPKKPTSERPPSTRPQQATPPNPQGNLGQRPTPPQTSNGFQSPQELIPRIVDQGLNTLCRDYERIFRAFPCSQLGERYRGQATGFYNSYRGRNGGIIQATELEETSKGLRSINRNDRIVYGSGITVQFLHKVGEELEKSLQIPMEVGDLSKQFGGRAPPHASHQNGLDIDIRTLKLSNRRFDRERNWEFLKIMFRYQLVHRIFTSNENKEQLCQVARIRNEHQTYRELFQRLQYWRGHTTHFHVRLKCTGHNDQSCRKDESPLPRSSGCD